MKNKNILDNAKSLKVHKIDWSKGRGETQKSIDAQQRQVSKNIDKPKQVLKKDITTKKVKMNFQASVEDEPKPTIKSNYKIRGFKAERLASKLSELHLEKFQIKDLHDERNTVLFTSNIKIDNKLLPLMVVLDDTAYAIFRVIVAQKAVTTKNAKDVIEYINYLNGRYRPFKYYVNNSGDIFMDYCETFLNDVSFDYRIIRTIVDVIIDHMLGEYLKIMEKVKI